MATLYELADELKNFNFQIDEETGEILNAEELDHLQMQRDEKIENICLWIKNLKADAEAYKNEKNSFAIKQKQAENKAESLKAYIQYILEGQKFKTDRITVSYRKSEVVQCDDISKLDSEYIRMKDPEIDKAKLKKALKEGVEIEGCRLIENQNMQIR
jgi:hypothetical protein